MIMLIMNIIFVNMSCANCIMKWKRRLSLGGKFIFLSLLLHHTQNTIKASGIAYEYSIVKNKVEVSHTHTEECLPIQLIFSLLFCPAIQACRR